MNTNQCMYKAAREVLPTNRIAIWEHFQGKLGNLESPLDLPNLPAKYLKLNIRAKPPSYCEIEAEEFMRGP